MYANDAGWRMKNVRKVLGIKRREMAIACGISKKVMKQIEKGERMMTAQLLAKICMTLGISADYILGLTE